MQLRPTLAKVGNAAFWAAGLFALLVLLAARTGAPPAGTVMDDCTVFGAEQHGKQVELSPGDCEAALSQQAKHPVPQQRPAWAEFVLNLADLALRLFR